MYSCVYSGHILFTIVKMAIGHPHSRSRSTKVGVPPGRVACVRTSHERTRQIDETFKYYRNLAWIETQRACIWLALGSHDVSVLESITVSERFNQRRESAARQRTRRTTTNEWTRAANEVSSVHFKESFVRTDSFANEPTLGVRDVSLERNPPGRGGPLLHLRFSCKLK